MRGLVLGQISFTPYKYFINENKLEIYDAVQINITETNQIDYDYFIPEKKSYIFEELYKTLLLIIQDQIDLKIIKYFNIIYLWWQFNK